MFIFAAAIVWMWSRYTRGFYAGVVASLPMDSPAACFYRAQQIHVRVGGLFRRKARLEWLEQTRASGHVTWVDQRLDSWLANVHRTSNPLEPEPIGTFFAQFEAGFLAMACVMGTLQLFARSWITAGFWFGAAAIMLVRLVKRRALFEPVVAGQGWIQHGTMRWTVADSAAIIRGRPRRQVKVTVIGPQGALRLTLGASAKNSTALREFWARWSHPVPRLDQETYGA
ncbi:MAG: hypothetical protein JNK53_01885 [Phycisphaerae bacterium]|nr:hypothetical protein [Phycisphaerae bacterium]